MRRAIILGSNGPVDASPLRYAQSDAERIAKVLSGPRCGFIVELIKPDTDPWVVRRQISILAEECTYEDSLICYFSGHGLVERGALYLLCDQTEPNRLLNTAIPVDDIVRALKHCKANSKLLVLDCCHAGAVVSMSGFKDGSETAVRDLEITPDNHLILMASDRLEKARELSDLQGSFLTTNICAALGEKFGEADKDGDNKLSIHELKLWLDDRAKVHNKQNPTLTVPYPYLFGQQKGNFYITLDRPAWIPYEIPWPDGSTMVVMPNLSGEGQAILISKHPITNAQYELFIKQTAYQGPEGKTYIDGRWEGPFYPWEDPDFSHPAKPVVCVSYDDARTYCNWVSSLDTPITSITELPRSSEWDLAAFGTIYPTKDPRTWLTQSPSIYDKATSPVVIDRSGERTNLRGVSDMIGNVWEWCQSDDPYGYSAVLGDQLPDDTAELRGGSFLDDLSKVAPFLDQYRLKDGAATSHSDLGFRISAHIRTELLPSEILNRFSIQNPRLSRGQVTSSNAVIGARIHGSIYIAYGGTSDNEGEKN